MRVMKWPLQREGRVVGSGLAEPVPSGRACGHRQEQFLTGLPTSLQPPRPPDHRLSGRRAASGSGPRLGWGAVRSRPSPLGPSPSHSLRGFWGWAEGPWRGRRVPSVTRAPAAPLQPSQRAPWAGSESRPAAPLEVGGCVAGPTWGVVRVHKVHATRGTQAHASLREPSRALPAQVTAMGYTPSS